MTILLFVEGTPLPGSGDLRHLSSGLRHLCFFIIWIIFVLDSGVSALRKRAGRSVSSLWPESVVPFGIKLFGFAAHLRRRQHHAGVVIPSPPRALFILCPSPQSRSPPVPELAQRVGLSPSCVVAPCLPGYRRRSRLLAR